MLAAMRRAVLAALVAGLALAASAAAQSGEDGRAAREPLRVLFVGNSLTATNDLPAIVAALAAAAKRVPIEYATVAPGGVNLEDHCPSALRPARAPPSAPRPGRSPHGCVLVAASRRATPAGGGSRLAARPALYGPDDFHPSVLGSTLAALVVYARLTGTPPSAVPLPFNARTTRILRQSAADALR